MGYDYKTILNHFKTPNAVKIEYDNDPEKLKNYMNNIGDINKITIITIIDYLKIIKDGHSVKDVSFKQCTKSEMADHFHYLYVYLNLVSPNDVKVDVYVAK